MSLAPFQVPMDTTELSKLGFLMISFTLICSMILAMLCQMFILVYQTSFSSWKLQLYGKNFLQINLYLLHPVRWKSSTEML